METISILGCGWLGLPLASRLVLSGHTVKGSTTSPQKLPLLAAQGIKPYRIDLEATVPMMLLNEFMTTDVLVITIPFKRSYEDPFDYVRLIQNLLGVFKGRKEIPRIIFTSSTMIYPDTPGTYSEKDAIVPQHPRQEALRKVEEIVMALKGVVVRLGGLYGPGRLMQDFMPKAVGKKDLNTYVNLIHLEDAVGIIEQIIKSQIVEEIINAVSDNHPTRGQLYQALNERYHLGLVLSQPSVAPTGKIVANSKIKAMLEYTFKYPDPLTA